MKISSIELQLDLRILYLSIIHQYTNFRPNYRSEGDVYKRQVQYSDIKMENGMQ